MSHFYDNRGNFLPGLLVFLIGTKFALAYLTMEALLIV